MQDRQSGELNTRRITGMIPGFLPFLICAAVLLLSVILMFVMGGNGSASIRDQLDGEVLAYVMQARHLFDRTIPEFLGGADKTSLTPASYGTLLFYLIFREPAAAFMANYAFVQAAAYVGMYLLLRRLGVNRVVSAIVALNFCFLPFYSVYGLSIMGQPLFWYGCLLLWDRPNRKSFLIAGIFALFSSPVLVGFADCLILFVLTAVLAFRNRRKMRWFLLLLLLMAGIYLLLYRSLISAFLFPKMVSHREEYVLAAKDFRSSFLELWSGNQQHAVSRHGNMIPVILIMLAGGLIFRRFLSEKKRKLVVTMLILVVSALLIALFSAAFHCEPVVFVRSRLGGIFTSFQFDRFYWLYPCIWYSAFGLACELLTGGNHVAVSLHHLLHSPEAYDGAVSGTTKKAARLVRRATMFISCGVFLAFLTVSTWQASTSKKNLDAFLGIRPLSVSFNSYYSPSLFREIAESIGKDRKEYRVACLALTPSVPLYNGFFCADGYSNYYSLEYKHRFRKAMAPELAKNEEIQKYYDNWGNRCYLFSNELGKSYFYTKKSKQTIRNLELDTAALRDLGCEYIFSGLEIENSADTGLKFLRSFEAEDSIYHIFVYRVS